MLVFFFYPKSQRNSDMIYPYKNMILLKYERIIIVFPLILYYNCIAKILRKGSNNYEKIKL